MDKNKKVIISGAGIAGFNNGNFGWQKAGFKPIIIEKSPVIRAYGFIVSLSHKSYEYAEQLQIIEKLHKRSAGIKRVLLLR